VLSATSTAIEIGTAIAVVLGSLGGAAILAQAAGKSLTQRRKHNRREDSLWGYVDEDGNEQEGAVSAFRRHIADRRIHRYERAEDDNGATKR
jgi:hypothetical protein